MNQYNFQDSVPEMPAHFVRTMEETLERIENMNRKTVKRSSRALLIAAIIALLVAGTAFAVSELKIFDILGNIAPIKGAEELVVTGLGKVETDEVIITAEEAVFDGQGAMVQILVEPRDKQNYAIWDEDYNSYAEAEQTYFIERVPVEVMPDMVGSMGWLASDEAEHRIESTGEGFNYFIGSEQVEIPGSEAEALEKGVAIYCTDGKYFYTDQHELNILGRRDGREMLQYSLDANVTDGLVDMSLSNSQLLEDGSLRFWSSGMADAPVDAKKIEMRIRAINIENGEIVDDQELVFTIPRTGMEKRVKLEPVDSGKLENFELLEAEIGFSKIRGYLTIRYKAKIVDGESIPVGIELCDKEGNWIITGSASCYVESREDGWGTYLYSGEMQSFEEWPESILLEVYTGGEAQILECRLVEVE